MNSSEIEYLLQGDNNKSGKHEFPLRKVCLIIEEKESSLAQLLKKAAGIGDAWLLAESPRGVVFRPWDGSVDERLALELFSIIVCGPRAEARMEKNAGENAGWMRFIEESPAGDVYLARKIEALLRDGKGRMQYEEYFRPDGSGFLEQAFGRLCGVAAKK